MKFKKSQQQADLTNKPYRSSHLPMNFADGHGVDWSGSPVTQPSLGMLRDVSLLPKPCIDHHG